MIEPWQPIASAFFQIGSTSTTFTANGSGTTSGAVTLTYTRFGDFVYLFTSGVNCTSGTSTTMLASNTALPSWARPLTSAGWCVVPNMKDNASILATPGAAFIGTSGVVTYQRDQKATSYTDGAACGPNQPISLVYYVGVGS